MSSCSLHKMRIFYAIGLLFLINGQVNSLPTTLDENDIYKKFEEWLNTKTEKTINAITETNTHAKSLLDKQIAHGKLKIEKSTADAFHDLHTWQDLLGPECYQQGLQQLEILKTASMAEFFHCERLKKAMENVGEMFRETYNVTVKFAGMAKNALIGLSKCQVGNKLQDTWCIVQYIWQVSSDIKSIVPTFTTYGLDIKRLAMEIKEVYDYCMHPTEHKLNQQVAAILEGSKLCAMN